MATFFLDTSAVVKRHILETGSVWVHALADPAAANRLYLARITMVEVASAVERRRRGGSISSYNALTIWRQFQQDMKQDYRVVEITPRLLSDAARLAELYGLRAYDAVQLAAAKAVHFERTAAGLSPVTIVSADRQLNDSAEDAGLSVEDPNLYP